VRNEIWRATKLKNLRSLHRKPHTTQNYCENKDKEKKSNFKKLEYSSDNMLFKLFMKNTQNELLLTRCY